MASPAIAGIVLRELNKGSFAEGYAIPSEFLATFEDLERITFNAYERDDNDWDLHFHLEDGPCRARVNRFVWNTGYYLRTQAFQDGKLQVLAHFVYTEGEPKRAPALRTDQVSNADRETPETEETRMTRLNFILGKTIYIQPVTDEPDHMGMNDQASLPHSQTFAPLSFAPQHTPCPQSQPEFENSPYPPPSPPLQNSHYPSSLPTWNAINLQAIDEDDEAQYTTSSSPPSYTSLPDNMTEAQLTLDFNAAQTKRGDLNERSRTNHAHAELMAGNVYGVVAVRPCDHCEKGKSGRECRIYNPQLKNRVTRKLGRTCGGCRAMWKSGGCGAE